MTKQIYIKRAEPYQDANYIKTAFERNNYGIIKELEFISKTNDHDQSYNGVIVTMDHWFNSKNVSILLEELMDNKNNVPAKMWHANHRYWIVIEYKSKEPILINNKFIIDESLPDNLKIIELEKLIKIMAGENLLLQKQNEQKEKLIMDYEEKQSREWYRNLVLASKLQDVELELLDKENKIVELNWNLACSAIDKAKKEVECYNLSEELNEQNNILKYVEDQAAEMRLMLNETTDTYSSRKSRMEVEELID